MKKQELNLPSSIWYARGENCHGWSYTEIAIRSCTCLVAYRIAIGFTTDTVSSRLLTENYVRIGAHMTNGLPYAHNSVINRASFDFPRYHKPECELAVCSVADIVAEFPRIDGTAARKRWLQLNVHETWSQSGCFG